MEQGYLIDNNAIIDFCNGKLPEDGKKLLLSQPPQVSVITNIELFASKAISEPEEILLKKFIALSKVHPVTTELIDTVVQIRREYRLKMPDAIIAATAIQNDLVLITRNIDDFKNVVSLQLINPHSF